MSQETFVIYHYKKKVRFTKLPLKVTRVIGYSGKEQSTVKDIKKEKNVYFSLKEIK